MQVSTPPHWDFTNLLVWPPSSTPPRGHRSVISPVVMRRSHNFCAHRYLKLFPFGGSSCVLRRYHPQITVAFSPAIPWPERRDSIEVVYSLLPTGTVMGLCQLLLNEPFTLSMAIRSDYAMTPVRFSPHLIHGKYSCVDCLTNSGRKGWLQSTTCALPSSKPASALHLWLSLNGGTHQCTSRDLITSEDTQEAFKAASLFWLEVREIAHACLSPLRGKQGPHSATALSEEILSKLPLP